MDYFLITYIILNNGLNKGILLNILKSVDFINIIWCNRRWSIELILFKSSYSFFYSLIFILLYHRFKILSRLNDRNINRFWWYYFCFLSILSIFTKTLYSSILSLSYIFYDNLYFSLDSFEFWGYNINFLHYAWGALILSHQLSHWYFHGSK